MPTKQQRLDQISDEVRELHPVLEKLLPHMPRVLEVEYTHGPDEKGADFVFSREHEIFKSTEYIGIVAKIGKIQLDFTQIERQIDECGMERFFQNGKKKIRLDEVWVVTTQTISNRAKEKISDKYSSRKIIFVDGTRLITLIDSFLPSFWMDVEALAHFW